MPESDARSVWRVSAHKELAYRQEGGRETESSAVELVRGLSVTSRRIYQRNFFTTDCAEVSETCASCTGRETRTALEARFMKGENIYLV